MYHLTDPPHARTLGGVRYIYIGSAVDGVFYIYKNFISISFLFLSFLYNHNQ